MKTISQFRKHLQTLFNELNTVCECGVEDDFAQLDWAIEIEEVKRLACRFGIDGLGDELPMVKPREALAIVGKLLNSLGNTAEKYLASQQAADYLGITVDSLYGLVERKRLIPLRGPRRSYRFTRDQLDSYLANNS